MTHRDERTPKSAAATEPHAFNVAVLQIAMRCKCSITSTFRTHPHNRKLKGATNSYHLQGLAADLIPDDGNQLPRARAMCTANGLELHDAGAHWHIEPAP